MSNFNHNQNKGTIIIVEGPQGSGKTTLANYLRDTIPASNLYRLSGIKDNSKAGYMKCKKMYTGLNNYIKTLEEAEQTLIFDRTFFTNEVYSRCGYKDYNFHKAYLELLDKFNKLNFNIYFINLYLKNTELYKERLNRKEHHHYQEFSIKNSINQQNTYLEICNELEKSTNIKVLRIATDDYEKAYKEIKENIPLLSNEINN